MLLLLCKICLDCRQSQMLRNRWMILFAFGLMLGICVSPAWAQGGTFSSGSTGADGAFNPTTSQTITVPASGVFNYTTVNIPTGVSITYQRNQNNTPVTILASGDVTIAGYINIDGKPGNANGGGGMGGPGGYNGGSSGYGIGSTFSGIRGDGSGGGGGGGSASGSNIAGGGGGGHSAAGANGAVENVQAVIGDGGPRYGSSSLLPLTGGSGGGGGGARANNKGGGGGGGGGAILIASSGTITFNSGFIYARGGASSWAYPTSGASGGGGAGGSIRLLANTLTGNVTLYVNGGSGVYGHTGEFGGGTGAPGYVRAEAYNYSTFTPSAYPAFVSFALPSPAIVTNAPRLKITSVGGSAVSATPVGSLQGAADVVVPLTQPNPITVNIEGNNIPLGTVVQITVIPATGARTSFNSGGLGGTVATSTATANVTLPNGMSVLTATAIIDQFAFARPIFVDGEQVKQIEVAATYGGESEITYITRSGRRIKAGSE